MADRGHVSLERANAADASTHHVAQLLGPALAGILIGLIGTTNVLFVDAMTFAASALLIATVVPFVRHDQAAKPASFLRDAIQGLAFVRRDRLIRVLLMISMVSNFLLAPLFALFLPVYAKLVYDDAARFGVMLAVGGAGALAGATVFGWLSRYLPRRIVYIGAYAFTSLSLAIIASQPPYAVVLAALFVNGFIAGVINPLLQTVRQERTPPELRGRVFGTVLAGVRIAAPIGLLLGGLIAEYGGVRVSFGVVAVGYALIAVIALRNKALTELTIEPRNQAHAFRSNTHKR